jgi:hypothetical protein
VRLGPGKFVYPGTDGGGGISTDGVVPPSTGPANGCNPPIIGVACIPLIGVGKSVLALNSNLFS